MDPRDRLTKGRTAARAGHYEEALNEYVWFHEHALESQPSLRGVRLSFALSDWAELAMVYPKARTALKEIRDRKTKAILENGGDRELFLDVVSINSHAFTEGATYDLFVALRKSFPAAAAEYASLALPAIVASRDFQLAREYFADPEGEVRSLSADLNHGVEALKNLPPSPAPRLMAYTNNYVKRVKLFLSILRGVGESKFADQIQRLATEHVEPPDVRDAVHAALVSADPPLGGMPNFGRN